MDDRHPEFPDAAPGTPHHGRHVGGGAEADAEEHGTDFLFAEAPPNPGVRKRRRRRRNIVMLVVLGAFAVVIAVVVVLVQGLLGPGEPEDFPGPGEGAVTFTVEPGWGPLQIGGHLADAGIVASKQLFAEAIVDVDAENKEIHPGEYQLKYKMPALDAANVLVGGDDAKVNYIGIKQNLRTDAVFKEVAKATGIPIAELEALNKKPAALGLKKPVTSLEGFLHPGEYRFPLGTPAKDILQLMVDATLKELQGQGVTDPAEQYRILKIASILQAESRPKDYATVSGALENRLHPNNKETGGLLQVDSSVIYGLDRYSLQISKAEKEDASNPYNTYVHPGLPPTPIGSPADSAIEAAIHPQNNNYYYWVTVNTKTGETKFATTYAQHRVYQNEFRKWCQENADICK